MMLLGASSGPLAHTFRIIMPFLKSNNQYLMNGSGKYLRTSEIILSLAGDGAWSWFADPRAIYYNAKTYFGYITSGGDVGIRSFNHNTRIMTAQTTLKSSLGADDHNNPSILIRDSDKKILAFYSGHDDTTMYLRIGSNTEDISSFDSESSLDASIGGNRYTYPNPIQLTGEANDPIYIFYRDRTGANPGDPAEWRYSKSTDGGASWGAYNRLHSLTYSKIERYGTERIHFAVSNHPDDAADHGIYHFYYEGGSFYQTDGTLIAGAVPHDQADMTQVYDGTTNKGWIWDITVDDNGNPVITFSKFISTTDHRYMYAKWNGSSWIVNEITAGGTYLYAAEPNYSGGVVLDHNDPNIVYLSKQVNGQWEIYKYTTSNGGVTFTERAITGGSASKNIRPVSIRDHANDLKILWLYGTYTTYTNYNMSIKSTSI